MMWGQEYSWRRGKCLAGAVLLFLVCIGQATAKEHVVFIHGTALFTPENPLLDAWNKAPLRRAYTGPYLGKGLQEVDAGMIGSFLEGAALDVNQQVVAANHIVAAYHGLSKVDLQDREYYVFGWSGAFARASRLQAAKELLDALKDIKKPGDTLTVLTHSHGSLALFLPIFVGEERQALEAQLELVGEGEQRNIVLEGLARLLHVDRLVMFAPPLAEDTARLAYEDKVFGEVYNLYSEGDYHQGHDCFTLSHSSALKHLWSTRARCSEVTFAAFNFPASLTQGKRVFDVRLSYAGNPRAFDHNQLFAFNRQSLFKDLWPLPVVALTPLFFKLFAVANPLLNAGSQHFDLDIAWNEPADTLSLKLNHRRPAYAAGEKSALGEAAEASADEDAARLGFDTRDIAAVVATSRQNYRGPSYWLGRWFRLSKTTT